MTGIVSRAVAKRLGTGLWLLCAVSGCLLAGCQAAQPLTPEQAQTFRDAKQACRSGQYQPCVDGLDALLQERPRSLQEYAVRFWRATALLELGREARAAEDMRSVAAGSDSANLRGRAELVLADMARRDGRGADAKIRYAAAATLLRGRKDIEPIVLLKQGCHLQELGEWIAADRALDRLAYEYEDTEAARIARSRVRARAWTIRLATCRELYAAREIAGELDPGVEVRVRPMLLDPPASRREQDLPAAREAAGIGDRTRLYAVLAGRYEDRLQAEQALPDIRAAVPDARITLTREKETP